MLSENELTVVKVPRDAQCPFSTTSVILSRSNLSTVKHSTSEVRDHVAKKTSGEALAAHHKANPDQAWAKQIDEGPQLEKAMRKVILKYTNPLYHGMQSTLDLIADAYNMRVFLFPPDESTPRHYGSEDAQFFCLMKMDEDGYIDAIIPEAESGVDPLLTKTTVPSSLFKVIFNVGDKAKPEPMQLESDYPLQPPKSKLLNHDRWMEYILKSITTIDDRAKKYDALNTTKQSYTVTTNRRDLEVVVTIQNDNPPSRVYHLYTNHVDPVFEESFTNEAVYSTTDEVMQHVLEELKQDIVLSADVYVKDRDLLLIDPRQAGEEKFFKFYLDALACMWSPTVGADYTREAEGWNQISEAERAFLINILAFFAGADGVVADNITANFSKEFTSKPIRFFFDLQAVSENIHNHTYALLIDKILPMEYKERINIFAAETNTKEFPAIAKKHDFMKYYSDQSIPLYLRLVAFACTEGIFFSSAFAGIFFFKKYPNIFPQLLTHNWYIMRDEGMHERFGCEVHNSLAKRCTQKEAHAIIAKSVQLESEFYDTIIRRNEIVGMDSASMSEHVKHVANVLCGLLVTMEGPLPALFPEVTQSPFKWMDMQSFPTKSNFFEQHETNYVKESVNEGDAFEFEDAI